MTHSARLRYEVVLSTRSGGIIQLASQLQAHVEGGNALYGVRLILSD
jgi:hypothetical protein